MKFARRQRGFIGVPFWADPEGVGSLQPTPVIESTASNIFNAGTSDTSCVMTMPSGIQAGDLLLHYYAHNSGIGLTLGHTGWTRLIDKIANFSDGINGAILLYRVATGSDSLTVTNSSGRPSGGRTWRISGVSNLSGTGIGPSAGVADFPAHNAGSIRNHLWMVLSSGTQASVAPTNFGNVQTVDVTFGGPKLFKADRALQASSLDPSTTDVSQSVLMTVAIWG